MSIAYRPDIDGLRAFSVLAVVFYHFFPAIFPGGFIGVDVFFVISGYLVTSILITENSQKKFSFLNFYLRRIRRILPALIVVLTFCLAVGNLFLFSDELKSLGLHTFFSTVFASNFLLIEEVGYFDTQSIYKPLLNLWSLAIEEQFYLVWPLIIWLFFTYKKNSLLKLLILLVSVSFLINVVYVQFDQTYVFYSLLTRFWELGAGGILAYLNFKNIKFTNLLTNTFISLFSICALVASVFTLKYDIHYPGYRALIPVVFSSLLIFTSLNSIVGKLLSYKTAVYIGLISYPLYLWHWPLLAISQIITGENLSYLNKFALIISSVIFSILTYKYIETPIRNSKTTKSVVFKIIASFLIISLSGLFIYLNHGLPARYAKIESVIKSRDTFRPENNSTIFDNDRPPTVAVLGDSHAASTYYGILDYYKNKNENLTLIGKLATPPLFDVFVVKNGVEINFDDHLTTVLKSDTIHTVILSAFWAAYYENSPMFELKADHKYTIHVKDSKKIFNLSQNKLFEMSLKETLIKLQKAGKKVILVHNVPLISFNIKNCIARPLLNNSLKCEITSEFATTRYANYRAAVDNVLKDFKNISTYDPIMYLCENDRCPLIKDSQLIYYDTNHLTFYGARLLFKNYRD